MKFPAWSIVVAVCGILGMVFSVCFASGNVAVCKTSCMGSTWWKVLAVHFLIAEENSQYFRESAEVINAEIGG